ncbi:MAG: hypothetical protein WAJ85_06370 [Candidatus Baltobacteraceae bacterium]
MGPNGRLARTFGCLRLVRFPDVAFGAITFLAAAIPLFHGSTGLRIHICGPPGAVQSIETPESFPLVLSRLLLGIVLLAAATYVARRSVFSSAWSRTHASAATSLLFVAAIAGVGFSVFDASMALHGPAAHSARHHFCWLSAFIAAAGAVFTIGVRAILTAFSASLDGIAALIVCFVRLRSGEDCENAAKRYDSAVIVVSFRAVASIGSRAPPVFG